MALFRAAGVGEHAETERGIGPLAAAAPAPGDSLAIWPTSPNPAKHVILRAVATPRGRRELGRTPLILVAP
jgi:hypothetical protein